MLDSYYTTTRPDMDRFIPAKLGNVLEVGCSAGGFSGQLVPRANEVWGVEPNVDAARIAATRLGTVLIGIYDDVTDQLPDRHFDLVICNDVIEHMPDHDRFLQEIKRKMKPGALLVGSLPNMRHITALVKLLVLKDWAYRDEGILDRTHLRFFTRKSIQKSLADNGYAIQAMHGGSGVLKHGFVGIHGWKDYAGRALTAAVIAATLGYYWDVQYPQFGFSARLP